MIGMLDRKLLRDLERMWMQVLAIALVMACGVATILISVGALNSLEETRDAFYQRYRFANVFASLSRAPLSLKPQFAAISGVAGVELRISRTILLDMPGMTEPATGLAISLPDAGEPAVNGLYVRSGRMPDPNRGGEVAVTEQFAKAHHMQPGTRFDAIINGRKRTLTATAIVLSPEYVFALGPGDMTPDNRRFGVIYMPRSRLAPLFDMSGMFNDVALRTLRGTRLEDVMAGVDKLLQPYGGMDAHGRADQVSNAFLDSELTQLRGMANTVPPIFLFVAAFLINMILSRLIALEREQIGLLKALGLSRWEVGWHYAKLVLVIAFLGAAIGLAVGGWLTPKLTQLYGEYYYFPFLIYRQSPGLFVLSSLVTALAALAGAGKAIWTAVALPAAVAMQPPAPARYKKLLGRRGRGSLLFDQLTIMAFRQMLRHPLRTGLTVVSTAFALAMLLTMLSVFDALDYMIETVFFQTEREDATLLFGDARSPEAALNAARLPGVMRVEPFRSTSVVLRHGLREKRLAITGIPEKTDLLQIRDPGLHPANTPPAGLVLSERVAELLDLKVGDLAEVELIDRNRRRVEVPVTGLAQSYVGVAVYMRDEALAHLLDEGPRATGVRMSVDATRLDDLYAAIKATPAIGAIALVDVSRQNFRDNAERNVTTMNWVYFGIAGILTFGVLYNTARIQLSERARELASLRVLGFTRAEVARVLLVELLVIVLLAQPVGWLLGIGIYWLMMQGFNTDLFRIPFVMDDSSFGLASVITLGGGIVSALIVRRRVQTLDLIGVLKTRG